MARSTYSQVGSIRQYKKGGQASQKDHGGKGQKSMEYYKRDMYEPCESLNGAPDAFERRYGNDYRKKTLPSQTYEGDSY